MNQFGDKDLLKISQLLNDITHINKFVKTHNNESIIIKYKTPANNYYVYVTNHGKLLEIYEIFNYETHKHEYGTYFHDYNFEINNVHAFIINKFLIHISQYDKTIQMQNFFDHLSNTIKSIILYIKIDSLANSLNNTNKNKPNEEKSINDDEYQPGFEQANC